MGRSERRDPLIFVFKSFSLPRIWQLFIYNLKFVVSCSIIRIFTDRLLEVSRNFNN